MTETTHLTVGDRLRALREQKTMSIVELAARTRVPAAVYVRGFIRAAAAALGSTRDEAEALVAGYQREAPQTVVSPPSITKSDLLIPILVRGDEEDRGKAALGIALLALAGLAIPIVAFLMS